MYSSENKLPSPSGHSYTLNTNTIKRYITKVNIEHYEYELHIDLACTYLK